MIQLGAEHCFIHNLIWACCTYVSTESIRRIDKQSVKSIVLTAPSIIQEKIKPYPLSFFAFTQVSTASVSTILHDVHWLT